MLKIKCDKCGRDIKELSALIFSPPSGCDSYADNKHTKYHISVRCFQFLLKWLHRY